MSSLWPVSLHGAARQSTHLSRTFLPALLPTLGLGWNPVKGKQLKGKTKDTCAHLNYLGLRVPHAFSHLNHPKYEKQIYFYLRNGKLLPSQNSLNHLPSFPPTPSAKRG